MFITFIYLYTLTFYKYITLGSGLQKKKKKRTVVYKNFVPVFKCILEKTPSLVLNKAMPL